MNDATEPAIVRASALSRLAEYPGRGAREAAHRGSLDPNPLVRLAAIQVLETEPPPERAPVAVRLLGDSTRAVRHGAAWLVAADTTVFATAEAEQALRDGLARVPRDSARTRALRVLAGG